MKPCNSHTHCQAAPANTQAKTWQRVCLPHPEKIELKKFPFPSENKKYATAQPNDRQKSVAKQTPKPLSFSFSVRAHPPAFAVPSLEALLCFISLWLKRSVIIVPYSGTARKRGVIIWNMVTHGTNYFNPAGYFFLDQKRKLGTVKRIQKQIDKFGLTNDDVVFTTV